MTLRNPLLPPGLAFAAALLLAPCRGWSQSLPVAPANKDIQHQIDKSILIDNLSGAPWEMGLYAADTGEPSGKVTAFTYDTTNGKLVSKGEYSPTRSLTLAPKEWVVITPVPEKPLLGKRPGFYREAFFKDGAGNKIKFRITRAAQGDKKPTIMPKEVEDLKATRNVFAFELGGDRWLNILKPRLN